MKTLSAILMGAALTLATAQAARADGEVRRSGYSYVRETAGDVSVFSSYNGRVDAKRNLPITTGDEISVADGGRAEVALADGNTLFVGGGTRVRFVSLRDQQGDDDQVSAISLVEGSVVLFARGDNDEQIPRIDTEDATIYLNAGGRVRVDTGSHRGTNVIARDGTAEVRTPAGSFRLRAGEFLEARGEEKPQIDRGAFSRDRFDIWVADRIDGEIATRTSSASAKRVDDQYASDVTALDGYGDWQYNDEYGTDVWSPSVEAGWTPYSSGSWYYTPAGLTWWSSDSWGWFPFHYGTWFFSEPWNRWCWRPAAVYSPAWVYWAYTPSFVGWCPLGSYSYWSPWFNNYYRQLGWNSRSNVYLPIHGVFSARGIDFRGWNFVGAGRFGTTFSRRDVIAGSRIADRLGSQVAVSSRPMVVNARPGQAREAIQGFLREAPRMVERTASSDSASMAPILGRQRTLPSATLEAVAQRAVVTDRGRLAGTGVADVAPRGASVETNRSLADFAREPGPTAERVRSSSPSAAPARAAASGERETGRSEGDWRSRPASRIVESPQDQASQRAAPERGDSGPRSDASSSDASASDSPRGEGWRTRSEVPPARRVIDGAVPGRRHAERYASPPSRGQWTRARPDHGLPGNHPSPFGPPRRERTPAHAPPPRVEVHQAPPPRPTAQGRRDH